MDRLFYEIFLRAATLLSREKYKNQKKAILYGIAFFSVGVAGFEPTTPCSQSRCANRTALHPEVKIKGLL